MVYEFFSLTAVHRAKIVASKPHGSFNLVKKMCASLLAKLASRTRREEGGGIPSFSLCPSSSPEALTIGQEKRRGERRRRRRRSNSRTRLIQIRLNDHPPFLPVPLTNCFSRPPRKRFFFVSRVLAGETACNGFLAIGLWRGTDFFWLRKFQWISTKTDFPRAPFLLFRRQSPAWSESLVNVRHLHMQ